jgi:DNA polymerase-3 subunit delta'
MSYQPHKSKSYVGASLAGKTAKRQTHRLKSWLRAHFSVYHPSAPALHWLKDYDDPSLRGVMFSDFPEQKKAAQLLQRSLERDRLGHAYLFTGNDLEELAGMARTLAKTLNCLAPPRRAPNGLGLDCCDTCDSCRRIDAANHPDVLWIRPESKLRVITIDQMRDLMQTVNLKPTVAEYKVGIIAGADRLNAPAANAFLKTLEEPPAKSVLILLTTEPQRILETIYSRCLLLTFAGEGHHFDTAQTQWLSSFCSMAAEETGGLLGRYRLLGLILKKLGEQKAEITQTLSARSPLERYEDVDGRMREKLEDELSAAIEAEYRRQRTDLIGVLQWWLRDVWLQSLALGRDMLSFPSLEPAARKVAERITRADALANLVAMDRLQRQLHTNVQEALALEVGLLKLNL